MRTELTIEEIDEMMERIENMRLANREKDDLTNKRVVGNYIIRCYRFKPDPNWRPVVRNRKYYRELAEKLAQEGAAKLKEEYRKLREEQMGKTSTTNI